MKATLVYFAESAKGGGTAPPGLSVCVTHRP